MKFSVSLFAIVFLFCCSTACHKSASAPTLPVEQDTLLAWQKITGLTDAEDIWFINPAKGFVTGNKTIYSSSDSGKTWSAVPGVSGDVYNLNFLNTQTGAAIGLTDLFITTNGGALWTRKPMPSLSGISVVDIQFTSPSTAYIATPNGMFKTTDTCNTWTKVYTEEVGGMFFFNSNEGIFCQIEGSVSANNIFKTTDGGAHWQGWSNISNMSLTSTMQFSDNAHGWLVNGNVLYKTIDSGATWTGIRYSSLFEDVFFVNNQAGYAASNNEIIKTTDGGQSWTRSCKAGNRGIWEVFFLDEKTGWACCSDGVILRLKQ